MGGLDIARAGTDGDEVVRGDAKHAHAPGLLGEGQGLVMVLEQHDAFLGSLARLDGVGLEVGVLAIGAGGDALGAGYKLEHAAGTAVEGSHREGAGLDGGLDLLALLGGAGGKQVVASPYLAAGVAPSGGCPVAHHEAAEAEVAAEDGGEQVAALHTLLAVDHIVRTHHRPGIALTHGYLEGLQVELAQGSLGDAHIDVLAVGLLVVHGKMLEGCADMLALDAAHKGCRHLTGEQRVFGVVLEVAASERIAVQVHARAEDEVEPVFMGLVADGLSHLIDEGLVPRRGKGGADGEAGVVVAAALALAHGIDAESGRAIGERGGRDAEAGDGRGGSGSTGHELLGVAIAGEGLVAGAHDDVDFLVEGHVGEHVIDIVAGELRRLAAGHHDESERHGAHAQRGEELTFHCLELS